MANQYKHLVKEVKRLSKLLDSDKGPTIKKTFDITTSLYNHGHENKPLVTVRANGDVKISVIKLLLVLVVVASVVSAALVILRGIKNGRRVKRRPPFSPHRPSFDDDIDIPF